MPKLLFFVPCEKFIEGKDNTFSLITILEALNINLPDSDDIPKNATIPAIWWVCSLWTREENDLGKEFEQKTELKLPDGRITLTTHLNFTFSEEHYNHRNSLQVTGFPLVNTGICILTLYWREAGSDAEWEVAAEYPIRVDRTSNSDQTDTEN